MCVYFRRIEMFGFKSFADKTLIEFEDGVTAIVGPNGCGKSNVSDAIRWVLGEQSAKSLRGASMEDVIFNGSSAKEPLNLAEVSLTLANETRLLPIDYDEVTITRRLYRSGDSEYLINKNIMRLRDIHEMLMGTGIGTENYSIVEQGQMELILNAKPEDRRVIFEEAAGITKYKSKKKEALRKLEQTEANLLRVNDIIQEVKRQIGSIERQAKKAENYKVEFEKMKGLELAVASREFSIFETQRQGKEQALESLKEHEAAQIGILNELEKRCIEEKALLAGIEESLRQAEAQEMASSGQMRRNQDRDLLNHERIGEFLERKENIVKRIEYARRRISELAQEYENFSRELEILQKEEAEGLVFLESVEAGFVSINNAAAGFVEEEGSAKKRLQSISAERAQAQNDAVKIHAQLASISQRLKRLTQEEEVLLKEVRELEENLGLPLFDQASQTHTFQGFFQGKVQEFKARVVSIVKSLISRRAEDFGAAEEAQLDVPIQEFSNDLLKIHGQWAEREARLKQLDETRKKSEAKLSAISSERGELSREETSLRENEQKLDAAIQILNAEEMGLNGQLTRSQEASREKVLEKEELLVRLTETRSKQSHCTARRQKLEKDKNWVTESKANEEAQLVSGQAEIHECVSKKETLEKENEALEAQTQTLSLERDQILRNIETSRRQKEAKTSGIELVESERSDKQASLGLVRDQMHSEQLAAVELRHEIDRLKERIFNVYQVDLLVQQSIAESGDEANQTLFGGEGFDIDKAKMDIQALREKLAKMGPVNLVAIEEYQEMKQRFDFLTQQEQDLVRAKDDLHKAILKINRTTKELFVETFEKVQKYFTEYYRLLFSGGTAELLLLDQEDVLESGIEIVARPPGKKLQSITLLSGGEKALTAVALLFALFKVRPSPFCVLDEIDAPLDEANVDRFCTVLKEFISSSQFIIITHNKRTMNLADALYGVTMPQTGVSKIVSVRFSDKKAKDKREVLV